MKVLVVGGAGVVGASAVIALEQLGHDVWVGSRTAEGERAVQLDLTDPASFSTLTEFDAVVNCADPFTAAPDAAAEHVVRQGGLFVETTADPGTLERLHMSLGALAPGLRGRILVGAGLFPGLSHLLVAEAQAKANADEVGYAVKVSPLSGCGASTAELMARMLTADAVWYSEGERRTGPPIGPSRRIPFPSGDATAVAVGLAEARTLNWSFGTSRTGAWLAPSLALLTPIYVLTGWLLATLPALRPLFGWVAGMNLWLLRTKLLAWRASPVEMVGLAGAEVVTARVDDGMLATSVLVAVMTHLALEVRAEPGVYTSDQLLELGEVVRVCGELGVEIDVG